MTKLVGKEDWVKAEFLGISLGDKRLNKRAVTIASSLSKNPKGTIPEVCKKWADIKGAYCFFSNKKVTQKKILAPHVISTLTLCESFYPTIPSNLRAGRPICMFIKMAIV